MMPDLYLYEKLVQAHHKELLREAEQQKLVAQLSEPDRSRHALLVRFVSFLRTLHTGTLSVGHYEEARARKI